MAAKKEKGGSSWLDSLVDVGVMGLENLTNRATLGRDAATNIRLAEESEYYAGINGSGAPDQKAAKKDAAAGSPYWRNNFGAAGDALGSAPGLILIIVAGLAALYFMTRR